MNIDNILFLELYAYNTNVIFNNVLKVTKTTTYRFRDHKNKVLNVK